MLKKFVFALIPMIMLAGTAMGEDDLLVKIGGLDVNSIGAASVDIEDFDLGNVDVDGLVDAESGEGEDAIAACFRRIGYGSGFGHRGGYGYGWHRPIYTHHYSYNFCQPLYCYQPVHYTRFTPIYTNYWGCY